jgi:hypothetical protein
MSTRMKPHAPFLRLRRAYTEIGDHRCRSPNADEMAQSTSVPAIQRLLGSSGQLGSRLGLDNKWMVQAIKAAGNYAEIFERNVGQASPLKLNRA